jgi:hypothetical protein
MINDVIYFGFMALVVLFVLFVIVRSAEHYKNYHASADRVTKPRREAAKPFRNQRAQEIWNRLNPKVYLDDDPTEPMPDKPLYKQAKPR